MSLFGSDGDIEAAISYMYLYHQSNRTVRFAVSVLSDLFSLLVMVLLWFLKSWIVHILILELVFSTLTLIRLMLSFWMICLEFETMVVLEVFELPIENDDPNEFNPFMQNNVIPNLSPVARHIYSNLTKVKRSTLDQMV